MRNCFRISTHVSCLPLAVLLLTVTASASPARADTIRLKNKETPMEGIIEQDTPDAIILNIGYGKIAFKKSDIERASYDSPGEQNKLRERWAFQYYDRPEFLPKGMQNTATEFASLETKRDAAIDSKAKKDKAKKALASLEQELERTKKNLAETSQKLNALSQTENLAGYNKLVEESNKLIARIRLNEYSYDRLQKQIDDYDTRIGSYVGDLNAFKKHFETMRAAALKKSAPGQNSYFLERLEQKLLTMDSDFIRHSLNYTGEASTIMVEAILNGSVPARLVVDTGASLVFISREIAARLGVKPGQGIPITAILADNSKMQARLIQLEQLSVGNLSAQRVQAAIIEGESSQQIDGLLGMSFLKNFLVSIDAARHELILEEFKP